MLKVSVVMPVYNGEKYLREAIDSVLNQTFTDLELLIIDDGSTDKSLDIIKTYDDPRISLLQNESNLGLVATRNKGLAYAKGEYIAWLDCDDIAYPERLAEQINFLDRNPDFGMVGSWIEMIDGESRPTGAVMKYTAPPEQIPTLLLFHNYFAQSALLIRQSALPSEHYHLYPGAEDYDMWTRIAINHRVWNLQKVLVKYRIHPTSITFTNARRIEGYIREIICTQLSFLNIKPSNNELSIHLSIGNSNYRFNAELSKQAEDWLVKLRNANKVNQYYKNPYFEACLGHKWFLVCTRSTELGWSVWKMFWQSPLRRLAILDMSLIVILWMKRLLT